MAVFESETLFPCSVSGLFEFLIRPENVARVSDSDLGLRFVSAPEVLSKDAEIEFQIVSFGQIHSLRHKVIEFEENSLLVEDQIDGPMQSWTHHHHYEAKDGGCCKRDRVDFEPPGGLIGFFLTEAKVIDQLEEGMFVRQQRINELIERGEIS